MIIIVILAKQQKEKAELMEMIHVYRNPTHTFSIELLSVETYAHMHTPLKLLRNVGKCYSNKKERKYVIKLLLHLSLLFNTHLYDGEALPKKPKRTV